MPIHAPRWPDSRCRPRTIYRIGIWLPIAIPSLVAGLVHGLGIAWDIGPLEEVVQVLLMSLLYGGLPYAPLALWATWWINDQPEATIRRLMMRAPLLMVAVFVPVAVLTGVLVGEPVPFVAVAVLGAAVTIPVGYTYVGWVVWLRECFAPPAE